MATPAAASPPTTRSARTSTLHRPVLEDVAPPHRVPDARLRRLRRLLRVLQEGLPGDGRPDGGPHGRRHGRHDVPPGRRAEEARRAGGRPRPRRPVRRGLDPDQVLAALEQASNGARWLAALEAAEPVVQRLGRRRLLPPPPLLGRRPDRAVRGAAPLRRADRGRRGPHPPDRAAGRGARPDRRRVPRAARLRGGEGRLRPDARPVPAGVPLHREPQVLLRALVHHPLLPEDPGVRAAARRPRRGAAAADDVFHLRHVEVEDALADVMLAWASGGTELGGRHWQPIVAERKRTSRRCRPGRRRRRWVRCPRRSTTRP